MAPACFLFYPMCSGKVYYDLQQKRDAAEKANVYVLRLEQLYPFSKTALRKELKRFPNADLVWCQEEPQNMGAWWFVAPRVEQLLRKMGHKCQQPKYVGRPESASTATGSAATHAQEQADLVAQALGLSA